MNKQNLNYEAIRQLVTFFEEYDGLYDMGSYNNCLFCIYGRYHGLSGCDSTIEWIHQKTGIEKDVLLEISLNRKWDSLTVYGLHHASDVKKQMVIDKIKEYFPQAFADQTFTKDDLESGMFVVCANGNFFQVIGRYLIGRPNLHEYRDLHTFNTDMTNPSNSGLNINFVYKALSPGFLCIEFFSPESSHYEKVYCRANENLKKDMLVERDKLLLRIKEIENKLEYL